MPRTCTGTPSGARRALLGSAPAKPRKAQPSSAAARRASSTLAGLRRAPGWPRSGARVPPRPSRPASASPASMRCCDSAACAADMAPPTWRGGARAPPAPIIYKSGVSRDRLIWVSTYDHFLFPALPPLREARSSGRPPRRAGSSGESCVVLFILFTCCVLFWGVARAKVGFGSRRRPSWGVIRGVPPNFRDKVLDAPPSGTASQNFEHLGIPVSVKKHSPGEEDPWEDKLSEHQIRDQNAVSAAGLLGQGSGKRGVSSQTPVTIAPPTLPNQKSAGSLPSLRPQQAVCPPRRNEVEPCPRAWTKEHSLAPQRGTAKGDPTMNSLKNHLWPLGPF